MSLMRSEVVSYLVIATTALVAAHAGADEKRTCVDASDHAQTERADGHLAAARAELLVCSREACPPLVRQFCEKWLGEVWAASPSIVIRMNDSQRHDMTDVRVLVDGALVATALEGRPLDIDPGVHVLRYEPVGAPAFEHKIVVVEGEKNRVLVETIPSAGTTLAIAATLPVDRSSNQVDDLDRHTTGRSVPLGTYILGGVGLAAFAGFLYFAVSGQGDYNSCVSQVCSASTEDSIKVRRVLAWSSLGVAIAAVGGGAWVFLAAPSGKRTRVGLLPVPGGGLARFEFAY